MAPVERLIRIQPALLQIRPVVFLQGFCGRGNLRPGRRGRIHSQRRRDRLLPDQQAFFSGFRVGWFRPQMLHRGFPRLQRLLSGPFRIGQDRPLARPAPPDSRQNQPWQDRKKPDPPSRDRSRTKTRSLQRFPWERRRPVLERLGLPPGSKASPSGSPALFL